MQRLTKSMLFFLLLIESSLFGFNQADIDAFLLENELTTSPVFFVKSTDSLKTALAKAIYAKDEQQEIRLRRTLGSTYYERGNINEALEYLIAAKNICDYFEYEHEKALTYEQLAQVYMLIYEHEKHYKLITQAIIIFKKEKDTLSLARSYNNLAGGEKFRDEEKTRFYLKQAHFYALTLKNELLLAEININYGTLMLREHKYDSAIYRFNLALPVVQKHHAFNKECETLIKLGRANKYMKNVAKATYYFNEVYNKSIAYKNYLYLGRSLFQLANLQYENGNIKSALIHSHKALDYSQLTNDIILELEIAKLMSSIFVQENKLDSAFFYTQQVANLKDTILARQNIAEIKNIEWNYKLKEKQKLITNLKEKQVILEQKHLAEQQAKIWFWLALFILGSLCVLLVLFFKNKTKLLTHAKQLVQLKNEKQQLEIEQKNKELVAHTMQIYSKSTTMLEIKKNIDELKNEYANSKNPKLQQDIQRLNFMIDNNIRLDDEWEKLKIRFQEIHTGFYEKLTNTHKELTQYDLKICTFIFLGFDTKQIAQILNIDYTSLRTQRYRIRKKMALAKKDDLAEYIIKVSRK